MLKSCSEFYQVCDEVIYFNATASSFHKFGVQVPWGDLSLKDKNDENTSLKLVSNECPPSILIFEYGVVVFWGLSESLERCVMKALGKPQFQKEDSFYEQGIPQEEVLHYYIDESYSTTGRVYGDVIVIRVDDLSVRLPISHALAQSVKLGVYEERLSEALDTTWRFPVQLAQSGRLPSTRTSKKEVNKKIGELFMLRMQLNLMSNILDTPEIFWTQVQWEGLYKAARAYLEIPQRIEVLNQRMLVISDLLDMLRQHLSTLHGEFLEWIVIILIAIEILMGVIEIFIFVKLDIK